VCLRRLTPSQVSLAIKTNRLVCLFSSIVFAGPPWQARADKNDDEVS
jgi:hypothetical protein